MPTDNTETQKMFIGCMCLNLMDKIKVQRNPLTSPTTSHSVILVAVEVHTVTIMFEPALQHVSLPQVRVVDDLTGGHGRKGPS